MTQRNFLPRLAQRLMAELFQTTPDNIGRHIRNIDAEGELAETATAEDFSVVQNEGGRAVRRSLKHYSLDAIIASIVAATASLGASKHWTLNT